jgi:TonB-linked SusC/RagA family outer membrane protein
MTRKWPLRLLLLCTLLIFNIIPLFISAQVSRTDVTGIVRNENGAPLLGVSVLIRNPRNDFNAATQTDSTGVFSFSKLPAGSGYSFSFSSIGYEPQTLEGYNLKPDANLSIVIKLRETSLALNDVVVVGYGTQRRANITNAITSVNSATIARSATPSAAGALQGNVPGAVVVKNTNKPGSGYGITIRGTSSIGGSSYPLIVVDGIPANINIGDINPADIEKIDILKDASATAIYGSRGSKGVIIITTKRGRPGKTTISYDGYMGIRKPTHLPDMMTGAEFVAYRTEQFKAQGRSTDRSNTAFFTPEQWKNIDAGKFTDWPSLVLQDALQMNHNITASGGDERTVFSLSAGLLQEKGNVSPEDFKRYTLRGNIDRQINKNWKAGISFYLAQNLQEEGSSEAMRSAYRLPAVAYPYDSTGARQFRVFGTDAVTNPTYDQENEIRQNRNFKSFGNLFIQVEPVSNLILKSTISPSYSSTRSGYYYGPLSKQSLGGSLPTQAQNNSSEQLTWVLDNQAIYNKKFGDHNLTATVIQSLQKDRIESNSITVEGLPYKSLWYNVATGGKVLGYTSGYTKSTLVSGMGRINYSYQDKYLLTATGRWDGSSRLAEGNQWGFFPSASVAWKISQEAFMQNIRAVNDLKLRVSYGLSGNDRVSAYSTQATLGQTYYDFGGVLAPGYAPNQLPNKHLTWETTKEINIGLDFGLLKGRIAGTVDVYDRKIDNILLDRLLPVPSGWGSITDNLGKLRNSGIEVGLTTINIKAGKFSWRSDFVFDRNKNKILELSGGKKDIVGSALFIGQPVQVNYDYVFDGIWQTNEAVEAAKYNQKPGQIRVKDFDKNGIINGNDRQIIGKRIPTWTGSFANTFKYGNIDLYIMVYTRRGEQFNSSFDATFMNYGANLNYNQVMIDYWTNDNPSQKHFQPGNPGPYAGIMNYRKVDFTRVGNITLGYTLPGRILEKFRVNNFKIYASAINPFLFTNYEGFDPEYPTQNTYGTAVSSATYLLGVNVSF